MDPLTERELEVLAYLPGRMRNQDIAAEMFLTVNTVKTHLAGIYRKLGVTQRNEAVSPGPGDRSALIRPRCPLRHIPAAATPAGA